MRTGWPRWTTMLWLNISAKRNSVPEASEADNPATSRMETKQFPPNDAVVGRAKVMGVVTDLPVKLGFVGRPIAHPHRALEDRNAWDNLSGSPTCVPRHGRRRNSLCFSSRD